jgi:transposase
MRFYNQQHRFYCGVDLHARTLAVCILDGDGNPVFHGTIAATPAAFLKAVAPFRDGLAVACECLFAWYWLADLRHEQQIPLVLGHALYMKAIHGGKAKTDKIDARKIAVLLRGGMLPQGYVYPKGMRETRDLLRRRTYLVRRRAEALTHLVNTNSQYNLPPLAKKLAYAANRAELDLPARFTDPSVKRNVELDLALIEAYDEHIGAVGLHLTRTAKVDDPQAYARLRSVPGVGPVPGLVMLYEIHDIRRFPEEGRFLSYARLVRCEHESAGKKKGAGGNKIGNAHLKWAFSEATCLPLRASERAKLWLARREKRRGKKRGPGGAGGTPGPGRVPPAPQGRGLRRAALLRELRTDRRPPGPRLPASPRAGDAGANIRRVPGSPWPNWGNDGASVRAVP